MSQEVFEIVCRMDMKNINTELALQCAPLITGIKISNLLILSTGNEELLKKVLKGSGISYFVLNRAEDRITYLLFIRKRLESYLERAEVKDMLYAEGYCNLHIGYILSVFRKRYQEYLLGGKDFPHEMGLLLGYPVEDVKGFIENNGENFLCTGYWKVYKNKSAKQRIFQKYEYAKETLIQLISSGVNMRDIIEIYNEDMLQNDAV